MELLQLKYFLILCESQHVSKTAEKLNISQPSPQFHNQET